MVKAAAKAAELPSRSSLANRVKKPSHSKAAAILPTKKASPTSIAKMRTVRLWLQASHGQIVPEATVRTVEAGIEAGAAGGEDIAVVVDAAVRAAAAIAAHAVVAAEIAAIARMF